MAARVYQLVRGGTPAEQDDTYIDLTELARLSGFSVRTLYRYLTDPAHPLPHHHVHAARGSKGRTLISLREYHAWVRSFPGRRVPSADPEGPRGATDDQPDLWNLSGTSGEPED